jgi:hypothetical protein
VLGVLFVILLIWNIILSAKLGKVKKQFLRLAKGTSEENLEEILNGLFAKIEEMDQSHGGIREEINGLKNSITTVKGRMGLVRFSAFDQQGSDLSFSLALLDEEQNGVVLTSLFGRDDSRIYAKPVENAQSIYNLTDEEKRAIQVASENRLTN